jgi:hypothetical protein
LQLDGHPGPIETAATHVLADDFAFGASGPPYIATHPEQTVFRLDAAGNRTTVAGPKQGAVGTTACAFGRLSSSDDPTTFGVKTQRATAIRSSARGDSASSKTANPPAGAGEPR